MRNIGKAILKLASTLYTMNERLEQLLSSRQDNSAIVYRRTQRYNYTDPQGNIKIPGQVKYRITIPEEMRGKFAVVYINGNVDARVPSLPEVVDLYSQDILNGDEVLILAYTNEGKIEDTLDVYNLEEAS